MQRRNVEFRLQLAGGGPAESMLHLALSEFGSRIEFLGELSSEVLQKSVFRPNAIVRVLSPRETGPLVAFEAMARGVVVVTSRFLGIGLEGSFRHGETCLMFEIGDADAAAAAIASLADVAVRQSLARAGHEMVRRRYGRQASVAAWDRALRTVWSSTPLNERPSAATPPPAGRLDQFLGVRLAENIRRVVGVSFHHAAPGDEWPHSYGSNLEAGFLEQLLALDRSDKGLSLSA